MAGGSRCDGEQRMPTSREPTDSTFFAGTEVPVASGLSKEQESGSQVEQVRPCCVCEETRRARDECVLFSGNEESCSTFIEAHAVCLASYGFTI